MTINIKASGMELTDAIKQYAEDKANTLTKYFNNIMQIDIDLGLKSHHHLKGKIFYCEFNVHVPSKLVRVSKNAEDLYKAIDKVRDHLKVELDKLKEKLRAKDKTLLREEKGYKDDDAE